MLKLFTVYDSKSETYLRPFSMKTTGEAVRGFMTTLADDKSEMSKYPADFTLFELGVYDETNATFEIKDAMINLGNGLQHKAALQQTQGA